MYANEGDTMNAKNKRLSYSRQIERSFNTFLVYKVCLPSKKSLKASSRSISTILNEIRDTMTMLWLSLTMVALLSEKMKGLHGGAFNAMGIGGQPIPESVHEQVSQHLSDLMNGLQGGALTAINIGGQPISEDVHNQVRQHLSDLMKGLHDGGPSILGGIHDQGGEQQLSFNSAFHAMNFGGHANMNHFLGQGGGQHILDVREKGQLDGAFHAMNIGGDANMMHIVGSVHNMQYGNHMIENANSRNQSSRTVTETSEEQSDLTSSKESLHSERLLTPPTAHISRETLPMEMTPSNKVKSLHHGTPPPVSRANRRAVTTSSDETRRSSSGRIASVHNVSSKKSKVNSVKRMVSQSGSAALTTSGQNEPYENVVVHEMSTETAVNEHHQRNSPIERHGEAIEVRANKIKSENRHILKQSDKRRTKSSEQQEEETT